MAVTDSLHVEHFHSGSEFFANSWLVLFSPFFRQARTLTAAWERTESMSPHYPWFEEYRAAMLEMDPHRLRERVQAARVLVLQRAKELEQDRSNHQDERQAIEDALQNLRVLWQELSA
jgi:hypothetical protein